MPDGDALYLRYHDEEWGRPVAQDRALYEKVCLEGFQSGLSWRTILHRREAFRRAFDDFSIETVARYDDADIERLLANSSIVRNRRKISSAINNAKRAVEMQEQYGSLGSFFWSFEPPPTERPAYVTGEWLAANPVSSASTRLARELKSRGWSFVGPTTMYALMQALGLVNDHVEGCYARDPVDMQRQAFARPAPARRSDSRSPTRSGD